MFLIVCFVPLLILAVIFYLYRSRNVHYWDKRGVPTAKGAHWFFGHHKDVLMLKKHIGLMFDDIYNQFPDAPFVGYLKMSAPGLLIKDPDLIKAVLQTEYNSFDRNEMFVDKDVDFLFGNNPFVQWGEAWQTARGHLTPLFTNVKLKNYFPAVLGVADQLVNYISDCCGKSGGAQFEATELAGTFTTDSVANSLCGVQNDTFKHRDSLFATLVRDIFRNTVFENLKNMTVFLFPEISSLIGIRFASKRTEKFLLTMTRDIIRERMENKQPRIDVFQEGVNQRENGKAEVFTDHYIASQAFACIVEGYETSSGLICFTLFELAWHNDVQEKLRTEIKTMVDRTKGKYTFDDVKDLKYLDMVLCESLRLHMPVLTLTKLCTADYSIAGHNLTIEKGTSIALPIHSIHRDPKFYPEPLLFDPERFSDDEVAKRHKFVYLPFGEGPRKCIGRRFALLQSKIAVIKIVENFKIIPNSKSSYQLEVDPKVFLLNHPLNGAWIQMRKLNE